MRKVNDMKNNKVLAIGIVALLFIVSVSGFVFAQTGLRNYGFNSMMGQGYFNDNPGNFNGMGSMMRNFFNSSTDNENSEPIKIEDLNLEVEKYIANYSDDLVIEDIFIFDNSDYYYSIEEASTGMGAMELLVNPYNKSIYPEFGPNMMWNLKYGMHSGGGMMGNSYMGRGMMGNYNSNSNAIDNVNIDNTLTSEDALASAVAYLSKYYPDITVGDDYYEFYGYYTFHLVKEEQLFGMLSVNGFTGNVWYHDWHGNLVEVIEN